MKDDDRAPGFATVSLTDDGAAPASLAVDGDFPLVARRNYAVGEEFARGGGGRLLRARDLRLNRVVAIKEPLAFSTHIERRFLREAVLTARLQHPSIVPVHEIGRWETGQPFYAMKLVSGRSLRDVVVEATTIEQRVALVPNVLAVADAIAYAHSQGVIHGDLKPSNVMVGSFGETQVIDWGLAIEMSAPPSVSLGEDGSSKVRGTPATMAPEQARGGKLDERTDVYGIGALLYEVLAGGPPYVGKSVDTVIARVATEAPPPLIDRSPRAPRELIAIAEHAMARQPGDRYASARELADDLHRFLNGQLVRAHRYSLALRMGRFAKKNRRVLVAGVASLSLGLAGALVARGTAAQPCEGSDRAFARVWGPAAEEAVGRALLAGQEPWAPETKRLVLDELARYGRDWVDMRREACESTTVRHVQSDALLDLRMECLSERLDEVGALATALSQPGDALLQSAPKAVYALTPLAGCADAKALLAPVPPPQDPAARAEVDGVRFGVARAKVLNDLGRYDEGEPLSADLVARAQALRYAPLEAEALEVRGNLLESLAEYPRANTAYREALWAAERGLDRARQASVMINLVWGVGVDLGLADQARDYGAQAAAVLVGLGGDTPLEASLANHEGVILRNEGRLDEAEQYARTALEKRKAAFGPVHPRYAMALNNLAAILADGGRFGEAAELTREAVAINAATLGEHHPDYALSLESAAAALNLSGRRPEALPLAEKALAVMQATFGLKHTRVAAAEWTLGLIEEDMGRLDDAERHVRDAAAIAEARLGADHIYVGQYTCALADVLAKARRYAEAVPLYDHALSVIKGSNPQLTAEAQSGLGLARLGLGKNTEALAVLEAALLWREANDHNARELAEVRLRTARALIATSGDHARARRLATQAAAAYAADETKGDDLREAQALLDGIAGRTKGEAAAGSTPP